MEMEQQVEASRYWCHVCSQMVNPITDIETIKCSICQSGFIEEMTSPRNNGEQQQNLGVGELDTDRALSLWAPIVLGMMSNPHAQGPPRLGPVEPGETQVVNNENNHQRQGGGETELVRELEAMVRQTRRSSATILRLLQGIQAMRLSEAHQRERDIDHSRDENGNRVILINPFNQTIILRGGGGGLYDPNSDSQQNRAPLGSFGDYFIGPGFDLLMQRLAENDPNVYGTPPAKKEAVEALPTVKVEEKLECSVCLDDCEIGSEVKEMPCKHKFHSGCILPWLELHSSCPVCRYQLPCDESKMNPVGSGNIRIGTNEGSDSNSRGARGNTGNRNENGSWFSMPLPWPLNSLFSWSSSQSSQSSTDTSSTNATPNASHVHEN